MFQCEMDLGIVFALDIVLLSLRLRIVLCQGESCLASISDLASIPPGIFMYSPMLHCKINDILFIYLDPFFETILDHA